MSVTQYNDIIWITLISFQKNTLFLKENIILNNFATFATINWNYLEKKNKFKISTLYKKVHLILSGKIKLNTVQTFYLLFKCKIARKKYHKVVGTDNQKKYIMQISIWIFFKIIFFKSSFKILFWFF
jgi:hypothetical protein